MKKTTRLTAKLINDHCENFEYFWAYGLVKETKKLWTVEENRNLLCPTAQIMVDQVLGE